MKKSMGIWRGIAIGLAIALVSVGSIVFNPVNADEGVQVTDNERQQCVDVDTKQFFEPGDTGYEECVAGGGDMVDEQEPATPPALPAVNQVSGDTATARVDISIPETCQVIEGAAVMVALMTGYIGNEQVSMDVSAEDGVSAELCYGAEGFIEGTIKVSARTE